MLENILIKYKEGKLTLDETLTLIRSKKETIYVENHEKKEYKSIIGSNWKDDNDEWDKPIIGHFKDY